MLEGLRGEGSSHQSSFGPWRASCACWLGLPSNSAKACRWTRPSARHDHLCGINADHWSAKLSSACPRSVGRSCCRMLSASTPRSKVRPKVPLDGAGAAGAADGRATPGVAWRVSYLHYSCRGWRSQQWAEKVCKTAPICPYIQSIGSCPTLVLQCAPTSTQPGYRHEQEAEEARAEQGQVHHRPATVPLPPGTTEQGQRQLPPRSLQSRDWEASCWPHEGRKPQS